VYSLYLLTSRMNANPRRSVFSSALPALISVTLMGIVPISATAEGSLNAPEGKVYASSVKGDTQITLGGNTETLTPKSYYQAQGARVDSKMTGTAALVLSNGTGLAVSSDTHFEVRKFSQEPFPKQHTDLEREPSTSQTEINVTKGTLAVSTSKLGAGSSMTFLTPLGWINLLDGQLVVEVDGDSVTLSLLHGEGTVHGGDLDLGGHALQAGEQAVIRPGPPGQPNVVEISKIRGDHLAQLDELASVAYAARKTVFFEADALGHITALPVVTASVPVQATVSPSRLSR